MVYTGETEDPCASDSVFLAYSPRMDFRHRHRRTAYAGVQRASVFPPGLLRLIKFVVLVLVIWWLGTTLLTWLGLLNSIDRRPAQVFAEDRGIVSVSFQGEEAQPAETGTPLDPGDSLTTGPTGHASLKFFDGSWIRLESDTDLNIEESGVGEESLIELSMPKGTAWLAIPSQEAFTGSILRTVKTSSMTFSFPSSTEAIIGQRTLVVFSADGQGVTVFREGQEPFTIGEGQQWILPESAAATSDPYLYRSPIDPALLQSKFLTESHAALPQAVAIISSKPVTSGSGGILIVSEPLSGAAITSDTIIVRGSVDATVSEVNVNGHKAPIDRTARTFSLEVAVPPGEMEFGITVEAFDAAGKSLSSIERRVKRSAGTPVSADSPVIAEPAKAGETYRTDSEEIVLRGTAPAGTEGIKVNEYRLQLFDPAKGTWSYIASTKLGNMKKGTNTFDVVAIFAENRQSTPARLTIIQGEGQGEGTVSSSSAGSAQPSSIQNPATLPTNAPLEAGSLTVTAPTAGTAHAATFVSSGSGMEIVIEGRTSKNTAAVWINDYKLQLYKPGVLTWNYVASTTNLNLKIGHNVYKIVTRDKDGKILDSLEYTIDVTESDAASSSARSRARRSSSSQEGS